MGNALLSPTAARFFPTVTRCSPVAASRPFSIASPFFRRGIFPSRCAIPFVCRVTPFIHCGILFFLHSPPPAHRGILLSRCAIPFVCRVTPFIHCGIPLFLHSPPPAHRGILLSRCAIPFVCRRLLLSHHRPPTIFCCISSFCCRIPLSHRGIFFRSLQHSFCLLRYSSPLPSFASFLPPYAYSLLQKAFFPPRHASHPPISKKAFVTSPLKCSYSSFVCAAEDERLECGQRLIVSVFLRIGRLMRNA